MDSVRGESSGNRRVISDFDTTACTTAESPKPRIRAHRTSQVIPPAKDRESTTLPPKLATNYEALALARLVLPLVLTTERRTSSATIPNTRTRFGSTAGCQRTAP